jgi:hypothetical protein
MMKTRQTLLLGLAGLGFVLAAPAYADPGLSASGFVLAKRDEGDAKPELRRESREEVRVRRNTQVREADHPVTHQDYGYGYERRQQPYPTRDDERGRR